MHNLLQMTFLFLFLILNLSCVEENSSGHENEISELESQPIADSLNFTSAVRSVLKDSKGNYWFGSHDEGVCLYDGTTFKYFTNLDGLANNQVRTIKEHKNGNILFGTANGVSVYDGLRFTSFSEMEIDTLTEEEVLDNNDLWFNAGNTTGVYRYDGKRLAYLAFKYPKEPYVDDYFVTGITRGKNNYPWFATYSGLFGYDGKDFTLINNETLGLKKETGGLHIRSILADSKGRLWIGNNGIGALLNENDTIINFSEKHNLIHPESKRRGDKSPPGTMEHVFVIEEDGDGNIWFSDRDNGVWKYDGKVMTNYTVDNNINPQMVWDIYRDPDNNLLFTTSDGSVYQFTGNGFEKRF